MVEAIKYEMSVMPVDERRAIIDERKKKEVVHQQPFPLLPNSPMLDVIYVPIELPIFRMDNARTRSWQQSYVLEQEKAGDFFKNGQETVETQEAQHARLVELSKKGNTLEHKTIWDVLLEVDRQQTEPLLITPDGLVVNGNRRLAAMREMTEDIPSFRNVLVQVLPGHLGDLDLIEIEARLQMAYDTRLDYEWTDEAQLIQDMRNREVPFERISVLLRKKNGKAVERQLEEFLEGQLYLAEGLRRPTDFEAINDRYQDFVQIAASVRTAKSNVEKDVVRALAYPLTKHASDTKRRLYDYRVIFSGKYRDATLEQLAERKGLKLAEGVPLPAGDDDIFADPAATVEATERFAPVVTALREDLLDKTKSEETANLLREIGDDLIIYNNDKRTKSLALKQIGRSLEILRSVKPERADPETYAKIQATLGEFAGVVNAIATSVKGLMGGE